MEFGHAPRGPAARSPELLYASVAIYGSSVFDFVTSPICSSPHLPLVVFPSARVNEEQYLARHFTVTKKHRGLHGMDKSSAPRVSLSYAAQNAYRRKTNTPAAEGTTDLTGDPRDKRTRRSGHDCNYENLIVGPSVHEYIIAHRPMLGFFTCHSGSTFPAGVCCSGGGSNPFPHELPPSEQVISSSVLSDSGSSTTPQSNPSGDLHRNSDSFGTVTTDTPVAGAVDSSGHVDGVLCHAPATSRTAQ